MSENKIGEQEKMVLADGKQHMIKYVDDNGHWKDLGILNGDGCLPAPWDETKYPKITVLIGNVYNIEVMKGHWFMQVRGDTLEKAVERWNRRA